MIPTPLWVVLFFSAGLIFVFMLFFADSGERAVVQALLIGTVVAVITAMLLLLNFLDNPFHDGVGGLRPWPWSERWRSSIRSCRSPARTPPPCDASGNPL